jgi:hypothetical protein
LNLNKEKKELPHRPVLLHRLRAGRRGKQYENEKKLSVQFYVMFPKWKKVHGVDGALPCRLHVRAGNFRIC